MKVETYINECKFEPVTLTITLESADEVAELWHRTNLASNVIRESTKDNSVPLSWKESTVELWRKLDDIAIDCGIKKD